MLENLLKAESGVAGDRTGVVGLDTQTDVLYAMVQQRLAEARAHRTTQATPAQARMRGDIAQGRHVICRCTHMHTGHTDDSGSLTDACTSCIAYDTSRAVPTSGCTGFTYPLAAVRRLLPPHAGADVR